MFCIERLCFVLPRSPAKLLNPPQPGLWNQFIREVLKAGLLCAEGDAGSGRGHCPGDVTCGVCHLGPGLIRLTLRKGTRGW